MMKTRLKVALLVLAFSAACHRGSSTMQREQKNYSVVSEGQASGVSSTINAPGETTPPMTNTSADTTSNFTLTPNVDTTGTLPPGTIAGTLPTTTAMPGTAMPAPMPRPMPATIQRSPSRVVITNTNPPATQTQPQQPERRRELQPPPPPPRTDTTAPVPPPEQTDTTDEDQNQPPPPPPPTQTDTRGW